MYERRKGEKRGKKYVTNPPNTQTPGWYVERNDAEEDWYEAEKSIDHALFRQALTPRELYQALMVRFYSKMNLEELSDQELAETYLLYSYEFREDVKRVAPIEKKRFDFRNVALLMDQTDIPFLTKRILMLAETSLLSHGTDQYYRFDYKVTWADTYGYWEDEQYLINCPDLDELGNWLRHARPLVEAGEIFYYPRLRVEPSDDNHLFDAIIQSRKLVQSVSASSIRTKLIRSVANINLPVIDNINLEDFSKITLDEHRHLEKFREHLQEKMIDLAMINGTDAFEANLLKIGRKIKKDTDSLTKEIRSLERNTAFQTAGVTIGTLVATLVAVHSDLSDVLPVIIGGGGGITALLKQLADYEDKYAKIEDSPYYYLWLLDTKGTITQ